MDESDIEIITLKTELAAARSWLTAFAASLEWVMVANGSRRWKIKELLTDDDVRSLFEFLSHFGTPRRGYVLPKELVRD